MSKKQPLSYEEIVRELEDTLSSLLGLEEGTPIDVDRRFQAMGLDSLLSIDLLASLQSRHGTLPVDVLNDHPTLGKLARYLWARQDDERSGG